MSPSPASLPRRTGCSRTGLTRTASSSRPKSTSSPGAIPSRSRMPFGMTTWPLGPTRWVIPISITSGLVRGRRPSWPVLPGALGREKGARDGRRVGGPGRGDEAEEASEQGSGERRTERCWSGGGGRAGGARPRRLVDVADPTPRRGPDQPTTNSQTSSSTGPPGRSTIRPYDVVRGSSRGA